MTVIVQVALAARVPVQVLACVNELPPLMETATPVSGPLPEFFKVMLWAVAAVP